MKNYGFQRVVAVFVGILLVSAVILAVISGEESIVGSVLALAAVYAVYMVLFLKKWKEQKKSGNSKKQPKSPLIR